MPFDQNTRGLLQRFVIDARSLLSDEFSRQLQQDFGLNPESGDVAEIDKLGHLLSQWRGGVPKGPRSNRQRTSVHGPQPTRRAANDGSQGAAARVGT